MAFLPWLSSEVLGSSLKGNLCHNKTSLRPAGSKPLGLKRWWRWRRQWDDKTCVNGWMRCQAEVSQALKRERPRGVTVQSSPSVLSFESRGVFTAPTRELSVGQWQCCGAHCMAATVSPGKRIIPQLEAGHCCSESEWLVCPLQESWPPTLKWKLLHLWWHYLDYPCE